MLMKNVKKEELQGDFPELRPKICLARLAEKHFFPVYTSNDYSIFFEKCSFG